MARYDTEYNPGYGSEYRGGWVRRRLGGGLGRGWRTRRSGERGYGRDFESERRGFGGYAGPYRGGGYGREYGREFKSDWERDYGDPFSDRTRGTPIRVMRGRWGESERNLEREGFRGGYGSSFRGSGYGRTFRGRGSEWGWGYRRY